MASGTDWNNILPEMMDSGEKHNPLICVIMAHTANGELWPPAYGPERVEQFGWKMGNSNNASFEAYKASHSVLADPTTYTYKTVPAQSKQVAWEDVNYLVFQTKCCNQFGYSRAFLPEMKSDVLLENLRTPRFKNLVKAGIIDYSMPLGGRLKTGVRFKEVRFGAISIKKSDGLYDFQICNDVFFCLVNERNGAFVVGAWDKVSAFEIS